MLDWWIGFSSLQFQFSLRKVILMSDKDCYKLFFKKLLVVTFLLLLLPFCIEVLNKLGATSIITPLINTLSDPSMKPYVTFVVTTVGALIGAGIAAAMNR